MVVYVDLAFLINFCIDAALLFSTATLFHVRRRFWRIGLAAGMGALYAVTTLFPGMQGLATGPVKLLAAFGMTLLAWGAFQDLLSVQGFRRLVLRFLGFLGVSAASGGAIFAMQSLFSSTSSSIGQIAYVHHQVVWWTSLDTVAWAALFPVAVVIAWSLLRRAKRGWSMQPLYMRVRFGIKNNFIDVHAFVDSGNVLKDPMTHDPVAILRLESAKGLLPQGLYDLLASQQDALSVLTRVGEEYPDFAHRFRWIPFHGVGGKKGHLLGIKPDYAAAIETKNERSLQPIILAIEDSSSFFHTDFDCLLPATRAWAQRGGTSIDVRATSPSDQTVHSSHSA